MKSCRRRSSAEGLKPGSLEGQVNFMFNEDLKKQTKMAICRKLQNLE